MDNNILNIRIRSPYGLKVERQAKALTSFNDKGLFDILPFHSNFISLIKNKIIMQLPDGRKEDVSIKTGVLKAKENKVDIFLDVDKDWKISA